MSAEELVASFLVAAIRKAGDDGYPASKLTIPLITLLRGYGFRGRWTS